MARRKSAKTQARKRGKTSLLLDVVLASPGDTLQARLFGGLRQLIVDGAFGPGAKLASTRQLAEDLSVSRNTVLSVLDKLAADGWIELRQGSGSYVSATLPLGAGARSSRAPRDKDAQVPFSVGVPALDLFPVATWNKLQARRWRTMPRSALQEGDEAGWAGLRAAIAAHLHVSRGIRCEPDQVIVTNGARGAIYLALRVLAKQGEQVWVEDPGYFGAKDAARAQGLNIRPIPVDAEGLDVGWALKHAREARAVIVTSHCQFPTGARMSAARRSELLAWAEQSQGWIVDNGYDSEFAFGEERLTSLAASGHPQVIYVNSFNKSLYPALRIGYLVAPPALVDAFASARGVLDGHSNVPNQMVLHDFLDGGAYDDHIRRCREAYEERRSALLNACARHLGPWLDVDQRGAGLHVLAAIKGSLSALEFADFARSHLVDVTPMTQLSEDTAFEQRLLLGFCAFSPTRLNAASVRLARACASAEGHLHAHT